jgi:hypothetical protein
MRLACPERANYSTTQTGRSGVKNLLKYLALKGQSMGDKRLCGLTRRVRIQAGCQFHKNTSWKLMIRYGRMPVSQEHKLEAYDTI